MRAVVVLYSEMFELDRSEVTYASMPQLRAIVDSIASDLPEAELVEVYAMPGLALTYRYTRAKHAKKWKEQRVGEHPNWGGWRPGAGGVKKDPKDKLSTRIVVSIKPDMAAELNKVSDTSLSAYVRKAIAEKVEASTGVVLNPEIKFAPPKGVPDSKYHRTLQGLPQNVRRYEGRNMTELGLHIDRTDTGWHVYYGAPDYTESDAPSFSAPLLISALEIAEKWCAEHRKKWIIQTPPKKKKQ